MKRPRLRKWAKWAFTLAGGALLGLWVFSMLFTCEHRRFTAGGDTLWSAGLYQGAAWVSKWGGLLSSRDIFSPGWWFRRNNLGAWGFWAEFLHGAGGLRWVPGIRYHEAPGGWALSISLVYPALLTSIPAVWLWCADRRRSRRHQCGKCDYDRRGLAADAKCPECGTAPAPAPK